jgi:hypothetical protein
VGGGGGRAAGGGESEMQHGCGCSAPNKTKCNHGKLWNTSGGGVRGKAEIAGFDLSQSNTKAIETGCRSSNLWHNMPTGQAVITPAAHVDAQCM